MTQILATLLALLPLLSFAGEVVKISGVSKNGEVILSDANQIKLADIVIAGDFASEGVSLISQWRGKDVQVFYVSNKADRNGKYLAYIKDLQTLLVSSGFAFYYSGGFDHTFVKEMLAAENHSIKNNKGVWKNKRVFSSLRVKENLKENINKFQVVEGRVFEVKKIKDKLYLNFEDDWKTDFTVLIRKENWKNFESIKPEELKGKKIQVRGWLEFYNGPTMEIYNEGQISL